jgi:membrane-associated phospholipid phosphatase
MNIFNYIVKILIGVFLISSVIFLFNKDAANLYLAQINNPILDELFYYSTIMGEALFIAPVIFILIISNIGRGIFLIFNTTLATLITAILKLLFNEGRPMTYIQDFEMVSQHAFWEIHSSLSFPSGHTTAAFALFISLGILSKNRLLILFYIILAIIVGTSRIYLFQHFFIDVFFGALIGSLISLTSFHFFYYNLAPRKWSEFSVISWMKSKF